MTCKDCVHYDVCETTYPDLELPFVNLEKCRLFKDKSKFIELPCKVGDTIYKINKKYEIERNYVVQIHISQTEKQTFFSMYDDFFGIEEIGNTVFLTKEEAEQALKEREQND